MIDIQSTLSETLLSMHDVAKIAGVQYDSVPYWYRTGILVGTERVKLEVFRIGGTPKTTMTLLVKFVMAINPPASEQASAPPRNGRPPAPLRVPLPPSSTPTDPAAHPPSSATR